MGVVPVQTQGGYHVRNLMCPTRISESSSQVPDEASTMLRKQLLFWRGHQRCRALEQFLLESLSVQCVKPPERHLIHSLWRQALRSSSVLTGGSDLHVFLDDRWNT